MELTLAFGLALAAAVLVSERARRTVLSTAVLFLVVGFVAGNGVLGLIDLRADAQLLTHFSELALFSVLFVEGANLSLKELAQAWRLPGRALLIGMPLTLLAIAAAARFVLGLGWIDALLIGAILSPTDPVFAAAILEREAVPDRLRHLLRVESGLNDGLALPVVTVLLDVAGHREVHPLLAVFEAAAGAALGAAAAYAFAWLERRQVFAAAPDYCALGGIAVSATVYGATKLAAFNEFLGAFAAGVVLATCSPRTSDELRRIGRPAAEAIKLAALLAFGCLLTPALLAGSGWSGVLFTGLTLLAARPAALLVALLGGRLGTKEWLAAAWFGPKGFASILYGLLMVQAGVPGADRLFAVIALVTAVSITAHSSTDVLVARAFRERPAE